MQDRETVTGKNYPDTLCWVLPRTWSGFWRPLDFEGGLKITPFAKDQHKMRKSEVREGVSKKHEFQCIVDAKIQGPDLVKTEFGR